MGAQASPETFFVGIAVLRNDSGDAFGSHQCETKTGGRAVVEDVHGVVREGERVGESEDGFCKCGEGVAVVRRRLRETKAGQVRRDDMVLSARRGMSSRYWKEEVGKPWRRRTREHPRDRLRGRKRSRRRPR